MDNEESVTYEEQYAPEEQYLPEEPQTEEPEQPVQKPRQPKKSNKKKSLRRRYGQIALGAMAVALILLILLIRTSVQKNSYAKNAENLQAAYDKYVSGDTTGLDEIRTMSESYAPAKITLELIEGTGSTAAAEDSSAEAFGGEDAESAEETAAATTEDTTAEEAAAATDTTAETDTTAAEGSSEETAAAEEDAEVTAARQLWDEGNYSEAMTAFDQLAAEDKLSFDVTTAASGDEVLTYGAVCSMLSLYQNVSTILSYSDCIVYQYTPILAAEGYDFDKPVYYFTTDYGDYVCAYSTDTNKYIYWSDTTETVQQVISGTKYDLVSVSTALDIRKMVQ